MCFHCLCLTYASIRERRKMKDYIFSRQYLFFFNFRPKKCFLFSSKCASFRRKKLQYFELNWKFARVFCLEIRTHYIFCQLDWWILLVFWDFDCINIETTMWSIHKRMKQIIGWESVFLLLMKLKTRLETDTLLLLWKRKKTCY